MCPWLMRLLVGLTFCKVSEVHGLPRNNGLVYAGNPTETSCAPFDYVERQETARDIIITLRMLRMSYLFGFYSTAR